MIGKTKKKGKRERTCTNLDIPGKNFEVAFPPRLAKKSNPIPNIKRRIKTKYESNSMGYRYT